jgi:hypothetical protein
MFKKGLISLAAASVLASGAYATSSNSVSGTKTHYSGASLTSSKYFTVSELNVTESINSAFNTGGGIFKIVIPANMNIVSQDGDILTRDDINGSARLVIDGNASTTDLAGNGARILLDINGTYGGGSASAHANKINIFDFNLTNGGSADEVYAYTNGIGAGSKTVYPRVLASDGTALDLNATSNTGQIDENATNFGTVTENADGTITLQFNLMGTDDVSQKVSLDMVKFAPASSTTTGDGSISFDGDGITTTAKKLVTFYDTAASLAVVGTAPKINADASQVTADLNVTFRDNMADLDDGNISIKLSNGKFTSVTHSGDYDFTTDSNVTLKIREDSKAFVDLTSVTIDATGITVGTDITATLGGDGNFTSASGTVTIASVVADGATVELSDSSKTAASSKVLVGGSAQTVQDINITEYFATSFATLDTLTISLPTDYTFTTTVGTNTAYEPTFKMINSNYAASATTYNPNPAVVSGNKITYRVADINSSSAFDKNDTKVQEIMISGMKIEVPDSAVAGETVALTISGDAVGSNSYTIDVATLTTTTADVESNITTAESVPYGATTLPTMKLDINESVAGALVQDSTITLTLSDGVFKTKSTLDTVSGITLYSNVGTMADGNKTQTWTVSVPSSGSAAGIEENINNISINGIKEVKTIKLSVGGTAGVSGDLDYVTTFDPANVTEVTAAMVEVDADSTGDLVAITFKETYVAGLGSGKKFRIISKDPSMLGFQNVTGSTYVLNGAAAASATIDTSKSTNEYGDTLVVTLPALSSTVLDTYTLTVKGANFKSAASGALNVQLKDGDISGLNTATIQTVDSLQVAYAGSYPEMEAGATAATVTAGGTYTMTVTGATGTITYTENVDDAVATIDAATGVLTVAADAAEGTEITITASDAITGQEVTTVVTVTAEQQNAATPSLAAGWNLVGNPTAGEADIADANFEYVYTYAAGAWSNATTVPAGAGVWVKATAAVEAGIPFPVAAADADTVYTAGTWSLVASTTERAIADVKGDATIIWAYDAANAAWMTDTDTYSIQAGQGYWIK